MGTKANVVVGLGDGQLKIGNYGEAIGDCDDVGYTEGGVEMSCAREYFEKMVDQEIGVLEMFKTAERATLKLTLAEATLANLAKALDYPEGAVSDSTLSFGGNATVTERALFLTVIGPAGATRVYTFHKGVITSAATHAYKKNDKTMIEMEIVVLQDTSKTTNQQLGNIVDTSGDTTAPTIAFTSPGDDGEVTQGGKQVVTLTITEANTMNENTIIYGTTIQIFNTKVGSEGLVAGSITYATDTKIITFTPTDNWTADDTFSVIATTGLEDVAGNALATLFIENFVASAV